ncbi:hypothetical protein RclHR1_08830005 [Rhizophagus clarus]|uniref:Uncharacterized protein n=1 Tax=Rhizophagus clarus TaxID=94130 RepID=A0A2Z6S8H8_9GLOM|nr:hypothetical protein RclHR1_08830005 [Rhizophagus clarus]GES86351.1 hypothetical protein RCL_jg18463.t1 [Rhizophagus clarus]
MSSKQINTPSKINEFEEARTVEQNQVERRQNADRIYNAVHISNEDNENRIINLPQQSISDPLWNQFFNGSYFY